MNGLERQFAQTVAEHKSTIYTVCYMFSQDADEVNDLFQEVLVNLWKGFESFEHRSDIRTWIYRVALNTCISIDRKKKRRSSEVRLTMDINLFEDRDEDTKQVDMLHKRISKLQPFDRAIVLLWLENLSYEEIGQIVGISTKNVSVRLFRIREQLKNMSNDYNFPIMNNDYQNTQNTQTVREHAPADEHAEKETGAAGNCERRSDAPLNEEYRRQHQSQILSHHGPLPVDDPL